MTEGDINNLIARIKKGDDDAFTELLKQHHRMVWKIANDRSSRYVDADDLAQIATMALYRAAKQFNGTGKFKGFAVFCIKHDILDYIRTQIGRVGSHKYAHKETFNESHVASHTLTGGNTFDSYGNPFQAFGGSVPPDTTLEEAEWRQWAINKLKPHIKERDLPIWQKLLEGSSHVDAVRELGLPYYRVENLMRDLRKRAKEISGENER